MAAVSPWFAMTRLLIEIRTQRARMESARSGQSDAAAETGRNTSEARPSVPRSM